MKKIFSLFAVLAVALSISAQKVDFAPVKAFRSQAMFEIKAQAPAIHRAPAMAQDFSPVFVDAIALSLGDYSDVTGLWQVNFFDASEDFVGSLMFVAADDNHICGSYTTDDNYCAVSFIRAEGDTLNAETGEQFEITWDDDNKVYHVEGSLVAGDENIELNNNFTVYASYNYYAYMIYEYYGSSYLAYYGYSSIYQDLEDEPFVLTGNTITLAISDLLWVDYCASSGWWQMYGYSADSTYYITLSNGNDVSSPDGTYDYEDMDASYTLFYIGEDQIRIVSGSFVVTTNADGTATVVATFIGRDGNEYVITCSGAPEDDEPGEEPGEDIDDAVENIETGSASKFIRNGQLIIERNGVRYNATGAVVE